MLLANLCDCFLCSLCLLEYSEYLLVVVLTLFHGWFSRGGQAASRQDTNSVNGPVFGGQRIGSSPKRQKARCLTCYAACLSGNFSTNWKSITSASLQGTSAGCPLVGKRSLNCSSVKRVPSASRVLSKKLPFLKAARATLAVCSGISGYSWFCRDMLNR